MGARQEQKRWLFEYLADGVGSDPKSVGARPTYDDGDALCDDFSRTFPGRTADPTLEKTGARVSRLLAEMAGDGLINRWRCSNHEQYHPQQEPNWQYVYALFPRDYQRARDGKLAEIMDYFFGAPA